MRAPRATYRLQLHGGFAFDAAAAQASYLSRLGVSHAYLSPILVARAGSTHGYDVVDPSRINPELGGSGGFERLAEALKRQGLGIVLDIVPNHMAVGGADNPWWLDVLERGQESPYARHFDIDWAPADRAMHGKVLAPFLAEPYGVAMEKGLIRLVFDRALNRLCFAYYDHRFPLRREDYPEALRAAGVSENADPGAIPGLDKTFDRSHNADALHALLERQHFRLAWWRVAGDEINWRRFFDINGLAALRMDREVVFEDAHRLIFDLYQSGLVDGLRIDHIDGLADPGGYCRRLRARLEELAPDRQAFIVVEKIFAAHEHLAGDWRVDGDTGYGFMSDVAALLHDPDGAEPLSALWRDISGRADDFHREERRARREVLAHSFSAQLDAACAAFTAVARSAAWSRDISSGAIRRGLGVALTALPAYRTYLGDAAIDDWETLERAALAAKEIAAPGDSHALALIFGCLARAGRAAAAGWEDDDGATPNLRARAAVRFEQVSAPLAAKAVEDTAFYRYGRLLSRNEVGSDPAEFSLAPEAFHAHAAARGAHTPATLLATATHDHKRGEDVRARLAAVSERPGAWRARVAALDDLSRRAAAGVAFADAYMTLQTLIGAWPCRLTAADQPGLAAFADRLAQWQEKALREAKLRSSWVEPNRAYESCCRDWLTAALCEAPGFAAAAEAFVREIERAGAQNGLAQTLLRCAAPGVPDCFQGCEFWDFSLVDPDNRRAVDFAARHAGLADAPDWAALCGRWRDGRVKQAVIAALLALRRALPEAFAGGAYVPLRVSGARAAHIVAFARPLDRGWLLFAACRLMAEGLTTSAGLTPDPAWWGDTALHPPDGAPMVATTATAFPAPDGQGPWPASGLFGPLPVAAFRLIDGLA